ncbi:MAG TPA: RdgB/HAM1 family non-canonical purine NTP pyrophosphatase [Bryobacteraceae bacterium]|jgi:XTP/dITP diphosphohydrolase|nr:RdgB/HAM1 family non-canonical purine NTP pyrophosphatase [Bryobacteraceae bacterium]
MLTQRPLYYCSSNPGKLREFALAAETIADLPFRIEALPGLKQIPAPPEEGLTFEENADSKASYYSRFTSELVFADDSGLEVEALGGAPGVHSARFAGPNATDADNNNLLLEQLANQTDRRARFVCVLALARESSRIATFRGSVEGEILQQAHGANGFGYDPLFFYPPLARSFGELTPAEKFPISHRGRALRLLFERLRDASR